MFEAHVPPSAAQAQAPELLQLWVQQSELDAHAAPALPQQAAGTVGELWHEARPQQSLLRWQGLGAVPAQPHTFSAVQFWLQQSLFWRQLPPVGTQQNGSYGTGPKGDSLIPPGAHTRPGQQSASSRQPDPSMERQAQVVHVVLTPSKVHWQLPAQQSAWVWQLVPVPPQPPSTVPELLPEPEPELLPWLGDPLLLELPAAVPPVEEAPPVPLELLDAPLLELPAALLLELAIAPMLELPGVPPLELPAEPLEPDTATLLEAPGVGLLPGAPPLEPPDVAPGVLLPDPLRLELERPVLADELAPLDELLSPCELGDRQATDSPVSPAMRSARRCTCLPRAYARPTRRALSFHSRSRTAGSV
jgi:hypothetical protein